ncbi:MAG: nucleotidyltransferase domain-containing protein, partial [Candidatus Krumholzibacteria bacterium]|nr:nucleotidyltransferase domain-containing protein [Candidatus Krumholzibacteria bacterium]
LNADRDEAVAILAEPAGVQEDSAPVRTEPLQEPRQYWRWRLRMAEKIAASVDPKRFGVKGVYVFGSAKNATAGPASDLDLIVHFAGNEAQREALSLWLAGWSRALAEVNYLRTGYKSDGLLDVHFVTDTDIENRTSYAVKIGAVTDPAKSLPMGPTPV